MSQLSDSPQMTEDERLADFTDRAMAGEYVHADADVDAETRALEETVLRLRRTILPAQLERSAAKQMQARFKARLQREARKERQSFWRRWLAPQLHLQLTVVFAALALFIALAVFNHSFIPGSSASATALRLTKGAPAALALIVILFIVFWISRRK